MPRPKLWELSDNPPQVSLTTVQSAMSKGVDIGPYPTVGKLWEFGKKLRSLASVSLWSVEKVGVAKTGS